MSYWVSKTLTFRTRELLARIIWISFFYFKIQKIITLTVRICLTELVPNIQLWGKSMSYLKCSQIKIHERIEYYTKMKSFIYAYFACYLGSLDLKLLFSIYFPVKNARKLILINQIIRTTVGWKDMMIRCSLFYIYLPFSSRFWGSIQGQGHIHESTSKDWNLSRDLGIGGETVYIGRNVWPT